jgi:hypothetical protein
MREKRKRGMKCVHVLAFLSFLFLCSIPFPFVASAAQNLASRTAPLRRLHTQTHE